MNSGRRSSARTGGAAGIGSVRPRRRRECCLRSHAPSAPSPHPRRPSAVARRALVDGRGGGLTVIGFKADTPNVGLRDWSGPTQAYTRGSGCPGCRLGAPLAVQGCGRLPGGCRRYRCRRCSPRGYRSAAGLLSHSTLTLRCTAPDIEHSRGRGWIPAKIEDKQPTHGLRVESHGTPRHCQLVAAAGVGVLVGTDFITRRLTLVSTSHADSRTPRTGWHACIHTTKCRSRARAGIAVGLT